MQVQSCVFLSVSTASWMEQHTASSGKCREIRRGKRSTCNWAQIVETKNLQKGRKPTVFSFEVKLRSAFAKANGKNKTKQTRTTGRLKFQSSLIFPFVTVWWLHRNKSIFLHIGSYHLTFTGKIKICMYLLSPTGFSSIFSNFKKNSILENIRETYL